MGVDPPANPGHAGRGAEPGAAAAGRNKGETAGRREIEVNSAGEAANQEVNEREGRKQKGTKCCDVIHSEALQLNQRDGE